MTTQRSGHSYAVDGSQYRTAAFRVSDVGKVVSDNVMPTSFLDEGLTVGLTLVLTDWWESGISPGKPRGKQRRPPRKQRRLLSCLQI